MNHSLKNSVQLGKINRISSLWHHNGHNGISNHQPHKYLLKRSLRHRLKKTSKLCLTGLCVGNSPVTGEFPAQMASNMENVSIWWGHHMLMDLCKIAVCPMLMHAGHQLGSWTSTSLICAQFCFSLFWFGYNISSQWIHVIPLRIISLSPEQRNICHISISGCNQGPVSVLLGVSSGCAQPITGQVTSVTWPVIGWAKSELTPSKRQKTGPGHQQPPCWLGYDNSVALIISCSCGTDIMLQPQFRREVSMEFEWNLNENANIIIEINAFEDVIWVRSRNCSCLVTWFCYQLIAKPGNKTATVLWLDPYAK